MIINPNQLSMIEQEAIITVTVSALGGTAAHRRDLRRHMDQGMCLVCVRGNTPIGLVAFDEARLPNEDTTVLIERALYVKPAYREEGVANSLVEALEQRARDLGCSAVLTGSSVGPHEPVIALYEGMGYTTNYTFRKEL